MTSDLISRKALISRLFPYGMPDGGNYGINARAVRDAILGAKAVEAEPVVRARWIPRHRRGNNWCECSACNTVGSPFWKRCPMCEAKMDEEVTEDGRISHTDREDRSEKE